MRDFVLNPSHVKRMFLLTPLHTVRALPSFLKMRVYHFHLFGSQILCVHFLLKKWRTGQVCVNAPVCVKMGQNTQIVHGLLLTRVIFVGFA